MSVSQEVTVNLSLAKTAVSLPFTVSASLTGGFPLPSLNTNPNVSF